MEWIKTILAKHVKEDGTVDLDAANKEIDAEFSKNAVPKEKYNNVSSQLKQANSTLKDLQEKTKDNPDAQKLLQAERDAREKAEKALADMEVSIQAKDALTAAGAKDIDYAMFKLGDLEVDKDGKVKDLDNKVKDLQKNMPDYFQTQDDNQDKKNAQDNPLDGFQRVDAQTGTGSQAKAEPTSIYEAMAQTVQEATQTN
ncbi:phage scaffolding protein [Enterococcus dispar]|uniref:phage scaffolding protein n=1 Tax=Enterococcus dispar TaxID=44009 RepID=UPI00189EC252|nr:phage scaffolding protein [Enterococcus dispar]